MKESELWLDLENNVCEMYGRTVEIGEDGLLHPREDGCVTYKKKDCYTVTDFSDGERWLQHLNHPGKILRQTQEGYFLNACALRLEQVQAERSEGIRILLATPRKVKLVQPAERITVQLTATASEAVVDAATGELIPHMLDGAAIYQRKSDGYVNATAMCQAVGKKLSHYLANQTTKDFLEELSSDTGIPASLLVIVKKGGIAAEQGTWAHPDVAINLGQWCAPKYAVQVSRWVREWMAAGKEPTFQLPQTYAEALRSLADESEKKQRLERRLVEESAKANLLQQEVREVSADRKHLGLTMAEMEKSVLLSDWLKQTKHLHGHGAIVGRRMLAHRGLLNRAIVSGCRHASEALVNDWAAQAGILTYKRDTRSAGVHKRRKPTEEDPRDREYDAEGRPVMIYPLSVAVTPDKGVEYLMDYFMTSEECLLRRLIQSRNSEFPELKRLASRYAFSKVDTSWESLLMEEERRQCVRYCQLSDGSWEAECWVSEKQKNHKAKGAGKTLQLAFCDLAKNYYKPYEEA